MDALVTSPEERPLHLDEAPAAPARRPRLTLIGTAFAAAASAAAIFGALGIYLSERSQALQAGEQWLPNGVDIPLSPGTVSLGTLAMSAVTAQWVVYAAKRRDRQHAYLAIAVTVVLGLGHILQMAYLWTQWGVELNPEATTPGVLLFCVIGLHVAMTAGGLLYFGLMALRSLGGQFTGRDAEGLSAATLYWYVTVGIFAVLWLGVLVAK